MDVNNILHQLGDFGPYQLYVYGLSLLPALVGGVVAMSSVFLLAVPSHRCFADGCDTSESHYLETWTNWTLPTNAAVTAENCVQYVTFNVTFDAESSRCFGNTSKDTKSCDKYIYDSSQFDRTAASEWNLVCQSSWKISVSEAIFLSGNLFGSIVYGFCSDRFGRRSVFYWGPVVGCISAFVATHSPNVVFFTIVSFFISFTVDGLYMTSFVLAIEFIGTKWRVWCATLYHMVFGLGQVLLASMAYFERDWQQLQLSISIIMGSLIILRWLFPESIRWQASQGDFVGAWKTAQRAARWNKVTFSDADEHSPPKKIDESTSHLIIFKHPLLRRWTINLCFNWIVNSLVYYELTLSAAQMGDNFNIFVAFILLSIVEVPFSIMLTMAMQWRFLGRRRTLSGSVEPVLLALGFVSQMSSFIFFHLNRRAMIVAGISCLIAALLPESSQWVSVWLGVIGKGFISASFSLVYFYTAEIYPTVVRSRGVGACSTFSKFGAILAPFVVELKGFESSGPLVICGMFSLIAGILALDLPETLGKELPDTIDDVYKLKQNSEELLLSPRNQITKSPPTIRSLD